ncbi:MAG: polymer-forming cytoskeletal protein, partial [Candidatus Poseidoniales archaeon]
MATQIQIKSSVDKNLPDPNSLLRGELAYSYASGKIFVGDSNGTNSLIIGGKTYTDLFSSHVAADGTVTYGVAAENQAVLLGPGKTIDTMDIGTLLVAGTELTATATSLNLLTGYDAIVTDNTMAVVSQTSLVTSQAIKEYVIARTEAAVNVFDFNLPVGTDQLLVARADGKFANVDVTGVLQILSDGTTDINDGTLLDRHIAVGTIANDKLVNNSVQIGQQTVALGGSVIPNINLDTSATLAVNRGGTGVTSHQVNGILIGNGTDGVLSSANFTFDTSSDTLAVTGSTILTGTLNVSSDVDVQGALNVTGAAQFDGMVSVNNEASFSTDVTIGMSSSSVLYVNNSSEFYSPVLLDTTLTTTGAVTIQNDSDLVIQGTGSATVGGSISAGANLSVAGTSTLTGDVSTDGNLSVVGTSTLTGAVTAQSTLDVTSNATVGGNLSVDGGALVSGNLEVSGDLLVTGNTVQIDVQTLVVEDNIIQMGKHNSGDIADLGVAAEYLTNIDGNDVTRFAGFFRSAADKEFYYFDGYTQAPGATMDGFDPNTMLATLNAKLNSPEAHLSGGTITNMTLSNVVIDCGS